MRPFTTLGPHKIIYILKFVQPCQSPRSVSYAFPFCSQKSRSFVRDRNIELILVKKEEGPYWPHLLKEKTKQHWLKVDFSRWKDEDDSDDEEGQNQDLEEVWDLFFSRCCCCLFY